MHLRTRGTALTAAALTALALVGPQAVAADAGPRSTTAAKAQVVVAHMTASRIRLSDDTVHAGRILFKAKTTDGGHVLQVARLRNGYTIEQAGPDIEKAMQGDVPAVQRVDHGISFRGGVATHPLRPGRYSTVLKAGQYVVLDQQGGGLAMLTVTGSHMRRVPAPHHGTVTTFTFGFGSYPRAMTAHGWIRMSNQSDQPHFVELQRVQPGTTAAMVRKTLTSGSEEEPSWTLKADTTSGVISPGTTEVMHVDLPAGRYLLLCWWPDDETGMPHALMGMWKLVTLR
jgi:hypothetical protein